MSSGISFEIRGRLFPYLVLEHYSLCLFLALVSACIIIACFGA